jgi:hypothetical protein
MKAAKIFAVMCNKFRTRSSNLKDVYIGSLLTWNWKIKRDGRRIDIRTTAAIRHCAQHLRELVQIRR